MGGEGGDASDGDVVSVVQPYCMEEGDKREDGGQGVRWLADG